MKSSRRHLQACLAALAIALVVRAQTICADDRACAVSSLDALLEPAIEFADKSTGLVPHLDRRPEFTGDDDLEQV